MRYIALAIIAAGLSAQTAPKLTDAQKLSIRDAQVRVLTLQLQAVEFQKQMDAANASLKVALTDAEKTCTHGVLSDLSCAPNPEKEPKK